MKSLLLFITLVLYGSFGLKKSPGDFEYKLTNIISKFKSEIMDKSECEKQKIAAENLSDEIKEAIENIEEYNSNHLDELKKLKKEAEALEEFIAAVGHCGSYIPSIENFNLANRRVGASVVNVIKDKYCVDVISVTIGDYTAYLAENNSTKNYTVTYKWKAPNGMNYGNGNMRLSKLSVRHFYDNREKPSQRHISIFGITCKEF